MTDRVFQKLVELREIASAMSSPEKIQKIVDNYQQDTTENNQLVYQQYIDKNILIELIQNNLQVAFVRVKHINYDESIKYVLVLTHNSLLLYSMNEYLDHLHMDIELTEIIHFTVGIEYDEIYDLQLEVSDNTKFAFQFNSVYELKKWVMLIESQIPKKQTAVIDEQQLNKSIVLENIQQIQQEEINTLTEQEFKQQNQYDAHMHKQEQLMKQRSFKKNDPSILKLKLEKVMRIGFVFLKYGKLGNPHQRIVFVKDDLLICKDFNSTKFKSINIKSIQSIQDGRNSPYFKRFPTFNSFQEENSFIVSSPSTTLSLEASSKEQKQKFVSSLRSLMVRSLSFVGKIPNQS